MVENFDVYPIRSPTVPKGKERIRIILHAHNKEEEVYALVKALLSSFRRAMVFPDSMSSYRISKL